MDSIDSKKNGIIRKGIAGFYYVYVVESGIYECKAKGKFRKEKKKPLVGDRVVISVLDEATKQGSIVEIQKRKNELVRPAVANVDQAMVIFAMTDPEPNLNLLDRFLAMMEQQGIASIVCFNKADLVSKEERKRLQDIYQMSGYRLVFVSAKKEENLKEVSDLLSGKISVVAGPSGVGKSTLINRLSQQDIMETGEISEKIKRGKHTTRHAQLIPLDANSYIIDTPGFTSLTSDFFQTETLGNCFPEIRALEPYCKFAGCSHIKEVQCGVYDGLQNGRISRSRYDNYVEIYNEIKNRKKF